MISASSFAAKQTVVFNFDPAKLSHDRTLMEFNAQGGKILISASHSSNSNIQTILNSGPTPIYYSGNKPSGLGIISFDHTNHQHNDTQQEINKNEVLGINWIASDGSYINIKSITLINFDNSIPGIQEKDTGKLTSLNNKNSVDLVYSVNAIEHYYSYPANKFTLEKSLSGKTFTLESLGNYISKQSANFQQGNGFALHSITFEVMQGEIPAHNCPPSEVPVPAAAWLFGSALLSLAGLRKKAK